ncbi:unnamed protein product, partial [Enterobius vermicularis]|uniref:CX domain-containing protein n=1 Tax=Enterobius vermicularis TaxID=51028 RepID=A0A158QB83_ENTVE
TIIRFPARKYFIVSLNLTVYLVKKKSFFFCFCLLSKVTVISVVFLVDNPDFLDCIYAAPNGLGRVVEQCLVDIGCCATTCCNNTSWQTKYRWAVALICIFSALVLIALVAWLLSYLFNRQKDKRQKKLLVGSTRGIIDQGYYPYVGGPTRNY